MKGKTIKSKKAPILDIENIRKLTEEGKITAELERQKRQEKEKIEEEDLGKDILERIKNKLTSTCEEVVKGITRSAQKGDNSFTFEVIRSGTQTFDYLERADRMLIDKLIEMLKAKGFSAKARWDKGVDARVGTCSYPSFWVIDITW